MKTYIEQVHEHLSFLRSYGFSIESFEFGVSVRCHSVDHTEGRGNLSYRSMCNQMNKGYVGIVTNCRDSTGAKHELKTYGLGPTSDSSTVLLPQVVEISKVNQNREHEEAARRAYGFWQRSSTTGSSDYLIRKKVGSYGIHFRNEKYGAVAVVPMKDENGWLWSYQLLNPDGTKRLPKGARTKGLFHILKQPIDGKPIGIAEGYVTAATCLELSGVSTVCCFSADNLPEVAILIRKMYPKSLIILFADNDRHLEEKGLSNQGLLMAQEAVDLLMTSIFVTAPEFGLAEPKKEASDWNDLVRLKGQDFAKNQMLISLSVFTK